MNNSVVYSVINGQRLERLWIAMGCLGNALTLTALA